MVFSCVSLCFRKCLNIVNFIGHCYFTCLTHFPLLLVGKSQDFCAHAWFPSPPPVWSRAVWGSCASRSAPARCHHCSGCPHTVTHHRAVGPPQIGPNPFISGSAAPPASVACPAKKCSIGLTVIYWIFPARLSNSALVIVTGLNITSN